MCTLTWQQQTQGYRLLFNRDERLQRAKAKEPRIVEQNGMGAIMPIDSQAGGTWISVNAAGLGFCLINNYGADQQIHRPDAPTRGLLAARLSVSKSIAEARERLATLRPERFNPFDLFLFDAGGKPLCIGWNGTRIDTRYPVDQFAFSSGFDLQRVVKLRSDLFHEWQGSNRDLLDYHRSHLPERGSYSVCMHREDASTQSLSEVVVNRQGIRFTYWPGPPCESVALPSIRLARKSK